MRTLSCDFLWRDGVMRPLEHYILGRDILGIHCRNTHMKSEILAHPSDEVATMEGSQLRTSRAHHEMIDSWLSPSALPDEGLPCNWNRLPLSIMRESMRALPPVRMLTATPPSSRPALKVMHCDILKQCLKSTTDDPKSTRKQI